MRTRRARRGIRPARSSGVVLTDRLAANSYPERARGQRLQCLAHALILARVSSSPVLQGLIPVTLTPGEFSGSSRTAGCRERGAAAAHHPARDLASYVPCPLSAPFRAASKGALSKTNRLWVIL